MHHHRITHRGKRPHLCPLNGRKPVLDATDAGRQLAEHAPTKRSQGGLGSF
jgi:hypothetical protein